MMDLRKHFNDWRHKPAQDVTRLIPGLQMLRNELASTADCPALDGIVIFFDAVSKWHDRISEVYRVIANLQKVDHGQYSELIGKLQILCKHFRNAGRDRCGKNRTEVGERVTEGKVFLGDIYGLWTQPVSFWKEAKNEPRVPNFWKGGMWDGDPYLVGKNAYDVVSHQAWQFMASHRQPMTEIIDWLERNLDQQKAA